ncbi:MAG: hypothetical protein ABWY51_08610 [Gaiellaceae bacterium]
MSTYDDRLLAARFAALAPEPVARDWADVVERASAVRRRGLRLPTKHRRLVVALAVIGAVALLSASAFAIRAIVLSSGPTKLPFEGATPSTPHKGTLVLTYDGRPENRGFPSSFVPVHQVWVYADGRVISRREDGPSGIGGVATGYLERRLTREGVERLRRKVLATGLFDRDLYLRNAYDLVWGAIRVRQGGRLVGLYWCCYFTTELPPAFPRVVRTATANEAKVISRLTELLAAPLTRVPSNAWADSELRAFVPSRYAVCYSRWRPPIYSPEYLKPSRVLGLLPVGAQELVRGKDRSYPTFASPLSEGVDPSQRSVTCSELTTDDARRLAETFRRAGFERDPLPPNSPAGTWVNWRFRAKLPLEVVFSFEPILPHGRWEAMGG